MLPAEIIPSHEVPVSPVAAATVCEAPAVSVARFHPFKRLWPARFQARNCWGRTPLTYLTSAHISLPRPPSGFLAPRLTLVSACEVFATQERWSAYGESPDAFFTTELRATGANTAKPLSDLPLAETSCKHVNTSYQRNELRSAATSCHSTRRALPSPSNVTCIRPMVRRTHF
jgi:hypothetical protein